MPVRKGSPEAFIKRGGRIPAPLQALKNCFSRGGFMENMIKKIVDADNEAKAMEKDTLEEKEELSKTIEAETKKIYDDFMAKAEEVVKRNDIQETKKAEQQWEEIQGKHNSVHIKLDSDFKLNCDKWVDEIVKRTVAQ